MTAEQIKSAALKLGPVEREALAEELFLSIAESDREAIDAAWLEEVRRGEASFATGTSRVKPVEEIISRFP